MATSLRVKFDKDGYFLPKTASLNANQTYVLSHEDSMLRRVSCIEIRLAEASGNFYLKLFEIGEPAPSFAFNISNFAENELFVTSDGDTLFRIWTGGKYNVAFRSNATGFAMSVVDVSNIYANHARF